MSNASEATKKRKPPIDHGATSNVNPAKRQCKEASSCFILGLCPELLGNIRSFLNLKEGLVLRSTCHRLQNDNCDVFRYCSLLRTPKFANRSYINYMLCMRNENAVILRNLQPGVEKLRAVVLNESITASRVGHLLSMLIDKSPTDNGEAVSTLLTVKEIQLHYVSFTFTMELALRRNFVQMAAALHQDERLQAEAQVRMCATCNENIGCYTCKNDLNCNGLPYAGNFLDREEWYDWSAPPEGFQEPRTCCRSCAIENDAFCTVCSEYFCPDCMRNGSYLQCNECDSLICFEPTCRYDESMLHCSSCGIIVCRPCVQPGQEWIEREVDGGEYVFCCQACETKYDSTHSQHRFI